MFLDRIKGAGIESSLLSPNNPCLAPLIYSFEVATRVAEARAVRQKFEAKLSPDQQASGRREAEAWMRAEGTARGAGGTKP